MGPCDHIYPRSQTSALKVRDSGKGYSLHICQICQRKIRYGRLSPMTHRVLEMVLHWWDHGVQSMDADSAHSLAGVIMAVKYVLETES